MDDGSSLLWTVVIIFFLFAAYFAVAETSFASVSKIRIKAAAERGDKRAVKALAVLEEFDRAVTTILVGTNITHLGIASIVTVLVIRSWGQAYVTASTLITTIAVFFFSEMLPKSIAKRYAEPLALVTASSLLFFMRILKPVAYVLTAIGQAASRLVGASEEVSVTEEELHDIIDGMTDGGMLDETKSELINSALDIADITVDSILTARVDMKALSVDTPSSEVVAFLLEHHHSRYPVYEGSIDHVIGNVQMRKYLNAYRKNKDAQLRYLIDPPFFVHYSVSVSDLIREMNKQKVSLAIVLDDWGGTYGMTTIADALEEFVGDIWVEADAPRDIVLLDEYTAEVIGDMSLGDSFEELTPVLDLSKEEEDFFHKRASEWAFEHFTRIPKVGDSFRFRGITIGVEKMRRHRILELKFTIDSAAAQKGGQEK